jgi:hypothetical protein
MLVDFMLDYFFPKFRRVYKAWVAILTTLQICYNQVS